MSADDRLPVIGAPHSLSPVRPGEGGGEGQGARDVDEPSDLTTRVSLPIERVTEVAHRSPLSPTPSPAYRGEGVGAAADRERLAKQQAALVGALAQGADAPAGFDRDRVATAAASLLAKRRRGIEKTWPGLAESLGDRFRIVFADYARSHAIPPEGPHADGRDFARYLRHLRLLSDDGRVQLLLAELGRRRPFGFTYLPDRGALAFAWRTLRGARRIVIGLPFFRRRADFSHPACAPAK